MRLFVFRSIPPEKDALQTWSKLSGEKPCRSTISTKPLCNFIEITPTHWYAPEISRHTCRTFSFRRAILGGLLQYVKRVLKALNYKKIFFKIDKENLLTYTQTHRQVHTHTHTRARTHTHACVHTHTHALTKVHS